MKRYTVPPQCFDTAGYGVAAIHAQAIYNILLIPAVTRYLEIGSGYGLSTSAAKTATLSRPDLLVDLCDVCFTPAVSAMGLPMHTMRSLDLLKSASPGRWDCVFVDGDHSRETVEAEKIELERLAPHTVIVHDTHNSDWPAPAVYLDGFLDYVQFYDNRFRGLTVLTGEPKVSDAVGKFWTELKNNPG